MRHYPSSRESPGVIPCTGSIFRNVRRRDTSTRNDLRPILDRLAGSDVPGIQYTVIDADRIVFDYAGGWADIKNQRKMTPETTLMAYSMTKTFTAVAVMQLVERGELTFDDEIDRYLQTPYAGHGITVRQLIDHTAGLANPIPLRWVHLATEHASFDEGIALARILRDNSRLKYDPGQKFFYSNIGYWLLGKIIEKITGAPYAAYIRANVLQPLKLTAHEMNFVIPDPARHANGYLAKYSFMNLIKGFVTDPRVWDGYESRWLRLKSVYVNGPAFGGLVGPATGFSRFLQDQLRTESVLLNAKTKRAFEAQQADQGGKPIPMTLGWHMGKVDGTAFFFKEGGGGGYHSEMRLYPKKGIGSVVMVNGTEFRSSTFLNDLDAAFLQSPQYSIDVNVQNSHQ
jgi:D-alanyl-D-alanine carboxypeptidase